MKAKNPHLAFPPVSLDGKREMTLPDMVGITEQRGEELFEVFDAARQCPTHTEALSLISHMVETPAELAFVSYVYMDYVYENKKERESPSGLARKLADALDVDEVHIIHI